MISVIISIIYCLYQNNKYEQFYKITDEDIKTIGIVVSNIQEKEFYNRYVVKSKFNGKSWRKFIIYTKKNIILEYGDLVRLEGEYFKPDGARNYKGFNYKEYLKTKKIYGTIQVKNIVILKKNKGKTVFRISSKIRKNIEEKAKLIIHDETLGLLLGITIGNKEFIDEETTENFRASSLSHILAISGAHTSYIILGVIYFLLKLKIPRRKGYMITIFILICFMFITDFPPSVVRACIMGIIMLLGKVIYRKVDTVNGIFLSLLIMFWYNPFLITDIGLLLSYGGTIGIITFGKSTRSLINKLSLKIVRKINLEKLLEIKYLKRIGRGIVDSLAVTISAQLLIMPIIALKFNIVSFTFFISNLLAVPLAGVNIMLGFVFIIISFIYIPVAKIIAIPLNLGLKALSLIAKFISKLPFSMVYVTTPSFFTIIFYYILIFIIYFLNLYSTKIQKLFLNGKNYKEKIIERKTIIIISLVLTISINVAYEIIPKSLKIYFIDVGQRR